MIGGQVFIQRVSADIYFDPLQQVHWKNILEIPVEACFSGYYAH